MRFRTWYVGVALLLLCLIPLIASTTAERSAPTPCLSADSTSYSSGWRAISPSHATVLHHGIDTQDPGALAVDLMMLDERPGGLGIHSRGFGGMWANGEFLGMHWQSLDSEEIMVLRNSQDIWADQYLLRMWTPSRAPDFDSGWITVTAGSSVLVEHQLGGVPDDYVAGLRFRNAGGEVHLIAVGGVVAETWAAGGRWEHMTDESVTLIRQPQDVDAEEMRFYLYGEPPSGPPDYDSGWFAPTVGASTVLTHGLATAPGHLVVRLSQRSEAAGRNNHGQGGIETDGQIHGAAWNNLTENTVAVWRGRHDVHAEEARVRIWAREASPCIPELLSPDEGAVLDNGCADGSDLKTWTFDWATCPDALSYGIAITTSTGYTSEVVITDPPYVKEDTGYVGDHNLATWSWRVRARTEEGWGEYSAPRSFTVEPMDTDCPSGDCVPALIEPAAGALVDNGARSCDDDAHWAFSWGACPEAEYYHLRVSRPPDAPYMDLDNLTTTSYARTIRGSWYGDARLGWQWQVRARVNGAWGEWSAARPFEIEPENMDCSFEAFLPVLTR